MTWTEATKDLRKDLHTKAYEAALKPLMAAAVKAGKRTALQGPTPGMEEKARNRARFVAISALAKMSEHEGVRNPLHDDAEWGPNATKSTAPKADSDVEALVAWLATQEWSDFATSLASQYQERGSLSPKQLAAGRKMKATMDAKAKAKAAKPAPKATVIDLTDLPSGYYAVPGGDTRLKVRVAHGKPGSKWDGWTFVSDGAEYGARTNYGSQRPGGSYSGKIGSELEAILAAPEAAQRAYGQLTGTCGRCGRLLEDENSIANGIGPVCANLW